MIVLHVYRFLSIRFPEDVVKHAFLVINLHNYDGVVINAYHNKIYRTLISLRNNTCLHRRVHLENDLLFSYSYYIRA